MPHGHTRHTAHVKGCCDTGIRQMCSSLTTTKPLSPEGYPASIAAWTASQCVAMLSFRAASMQDILLSHLTISSHPPTVTHTQHHVHHRCGLNTIKWQPHKRRQVRHANSHLLNVARTLPLSQHRTVCLVVFLPSVAEGGACISTFRGQSFVASSVYLSKHQTGAPLHNQALPGKTPSRSCSIATFPLLFTSSASSADINIHAPRLPVPGPCTAPWHSLQ